MSGLAKNAKRAAAFRLGVSAETRAMIFLGAKGYRTIARRWKSPGGEIDLVIKRGRLIAFVEVKARKALDQAAESLLVRQRRRIVAAPAAWLPAHPDHPAYPIP